MKHYCVISHTHWDREWYQTQEQFRLRLIDLMDHLLKILDCNPDYVFHMDAQTVVFDDYFEVRPEMREKCERYIKSGRILAGPWYVQNDFYLTSGEATIRNLLIGTKKAQELGSCALTAYAPDQFGLISQLPQIISGFDLDHCVFGRGYTFIEIDKNGKQKIVDRPSEINWKSPDGSSVLGIHLPKFYNNAQRFSEDIDRAILFLEHIKEGLKNSASTDYLLLMNGVDHLEPQGNLLPILDKMQQRLPEGESIYQTSLQKYAKLIKQAKPTESLPTETGELKWGADLNLLKDTASSRIYLKRKNQELQNLLSYKLEPLYTALRLAGLHSIYPAGHLDYLWKTLIQNHAHDSICGCSCDAVHRQVEERFSRVEQMAEELVSRGMRQLMAHTTEGFSQNDYQIAVFNPLNRARSEVVEVVLDILEKDKPEVLNITTPDGKCAEFSVVSRTVLEKSVFSPVNLPGRFLTVRYKLKLYANDIAPLSYKIYRVEINENAKEDKKPPITRKNGSAYVLENEHIKVNLHRSGQIDLKHKKTGKVYPDVLMLFDTADAGDSYIYRPIENDTPIELCKFTPEITAENFGSLEGAAVLNYSIPLPITLDIENKKRSKETINTPISIRLSLKKNSPYLEIQVKFLNQSKNHRLCARVRTGLKTDFAVASTPFDMVARNKWAIDTRICNLTEHHNGAVALCQSSEGVTVLSRGSYAYEHLQGEDGTLIFPIVRCNGVISAGLLSGDETWRAEENQCLRNIEFELALMPHSDQNYISESAFFCKAFQNPMLAQGEAVDIKKFTGGRPGVQNSALAELFYLPLDYPNIKLAASGNAIEFSSEDIVLTAFRQSIDRDSVILRFVNIKDVPIETEINFGELEISRVYRADLNEKIKTELPIENSRVHLELRQKEIATLRIWEK